MKEVVDPSQLPTAVVVRIKPLKLQLQRRR